MKNFKIFGEENGEIAPYFTSKNGKWRCACCGDEVDADLVAAILVMQSSNDDDYISDKEVA